MPTLEVPGAVISFESKGSGPYLLLIPGARGSASIFGRVAPVLAESFTVITYDRRGHSKSPLTAEQDYSQRLETDAEDAAALIKHVSNGSPVNVFGTSSGAIVAWSLVSRHSELIRKIILHEPPLLRALPDGDELIEKTEKIYDTYRARGHVPAMAQFMQIYLSQAEGKSLAAFRAGAVDPYDFGNLQYWFERELFVYPSKHIDYEKLATLKDKIIFADSVVGKHLPAGRAPKEMATKLGMSVMTMPGGHVGYLTDPKEFKDSLSAALK